MEAVYIHNFKESYIFCIACQQDVLLKLKTLSLEINRQMELKVILNTNLKCTLVFNSVIVKHTSNINK